MHCSISLKLICVEYIAKNLDFWCMEENRYSTPSLFELPWCLLKSIIKEIKDKEICLRERHLDRLLVPYSPELSNRGHNWHHTIDISFILHLAAIRCKYLRVLDLDCIRIQEKVWQHVIPKFAKLEILWVTSSNITDRNLDAVGRYLIKLRSLNLAECPNISDKGMFNLCVGTTNDSGPAKRCPTLETLYLKNTRVGIDGLHCVLKHLNRLLRFQHCDAGLAVGTLDHNGPTETQLTNYRFRELEFEIGRLMREDILQKVVAMCPELTHLVVTIDSQVSPFLLSVLANFQMLRGLSITDRGEYVTSDAFELGILPILTARGDNITTVRLQGVRSINLHIIGQLCVNLKTLKLGGVEHYSVSVQLQSHGQQELFPVLTDLYVAFDIISYDLTDASYMSLLASPSLRDVQVLNSERLTTGFLMGVIGLNPNPSWRTLEFVACCHLTIEAFKEILHHQNSKLRLITFQFCPNITEGDVSDLNQIMKRNGLKTKIKHIRWN